MDVKMLRVAHLLIADEVKCLKETILGVSVVFSVLWLWKIMLP